MFNDYNGFFFLLVLVSILYFVFFSPFHCRFWFKSPVHTHSLSFICFYIQIIWLEEDKMGRRGEETLLTKSTNGGATIVSSSKYIWLPFYYYYSAFPSFVFLSGTILNTLFFLYRRIKFLFFFIVFFFILSYFILSLFFLNRNHKMLWFPFHFLLLLWYILYKIIT